MKAAELLSLPLHVLACRLSSTWHCCLVLIRQGVCRRRIYCVLTSPHVNKNAREHFEIRTHKRIIDVRDLPQATIEKLFSLEIPAGVQVRVSV